MFFAKSVRTPLMPQTETAVIGTSPQAFVIGDILQNNGCKVTFLVPENKADRYAENFSVTFRPSGFQNRRAEFSFASEIKDAPAFVFLASNPEDIKNDLLLLSAPTLKAVPVINLSFAYNRRFLKDLPNAAFFPAFLDGLFLFEKNILTFAGRPQNLEICAPTDTVTSLKNLFTPALNINKTPSQNDLFWQNFAPFFLGNLIILAQKQSISSALNNPQTRLLTDSALKELAALAKEEKSTFDTSKALTAVYGFTDNYVGEFATMQKITPLLDCFPQINRFDTPALYKLTAKALNKY